MSRLALSSVGHEVREFLLLEQQEKKTAAFKESQRRDMRAYVDAANRRLLVARDIRGPSQTPVALELYREAAIFYVLAFLVSKEESLDPSALTPEAALAKLDDAMAAEGITPPPELARVRPLLLVDDPLELDRLRDEESDRRAEDFEVTTRWLARLFDARSPREFKTARILRLSLASAAVLAAIVYFFAWILAPKNLARGRPTTISGSTMFSTVGAGVVDGSTSGQYGYHSALEDSPWLSIDLGKPYALNRIKVFGRGDEYHDQSIPLALESSDDGVTYQKFAERTEPFSADDPWVVRPTGVVTRYLRLHTLRRSYLVLGEVEVYGQKPK
jgi:hypothetical protein